MEEIKILLNKRWILKRTEPDLYFKIKDAHKEYQEFLKDKLGYSLIINPIMVKVEKIPGKPLSWMGIDSFEAPLAYSFLCFILMFLEEKDAEEQFVLSQITDYIKSQFTESESIDWTVYQNRKILIKVMDFCKQEGMILVSDGDDSAFASSESSMEVLYENTGSSKYFVRRFPFDITGLESASEFEEIDWQTDDSDRGLARRHRIYRRLVMEPVVYQSSFEDQDYLYIKNMRSNLTHDMEKYLGADLHIHKNGALLLFQDTSDIDYVLPNRKNLSDIVLQTCLEIRKNVKSENFKRSFDDVITISEVKWKEHLDKVRFIYGEGWSKAYREIGSKALFEDVTEYMISFGMLERHSSSREISIMPLAAKITGNYPEDYWKKKEEKEDGNMDDK